MSSVWDAGPQPELEFTTNGYPDGEVYYQSAKDYIRRVKAAAGWSYSQQYWARRFERELGEYFKEKEAK